MNFTQANPSREYLVALEESKQHHRGHKTWSGALMSRHLERIKEVIDRYECQSALDYGCGRLLQYIRPAPDGGDPEKYLGIPVFKMDPAVPEDYKLLPEMAAVTGGKRIPIPTSLPDGVTWDLVICTHSLGSIPLSDLQDWVVPLLHARANKVLFITENLNSPHKKPFETTADKPREWTAAQWMELLEIPGGKPVEAWFRGLAGNDPEKTGTKGPGFRRWPFHDD